ncbi:MAG: alpha-glucosidase C-terminal domain-containing protein [Anaerolineaceae bacterium]|nr:alpha-glucosidase C-terminal domain-containing protein [Anaerolineaceae bacterium]
MKNNWANEAVFYHIYPLGLCDALYENDFQAIPSSKIDQLYPWLDHIQHLGATAIYLGPIFESSKHGYDTADYFKVDRRLGNQQIMADWSREVHQRGLRLVLDGVFNHVGRDFWAFKDLQNYGAVSRYVDWFQNINFNNRSPFQDAFSYEGWAGHYDLVKLNLENPEVRQHIFEAVRYWVETFNIDGLRLDAADKISPDFFKALKRYCKTLRSDFWLMGEIVFGDYRELVNAEMLDSATNYEIYKSLYSSHVDANYFELAYALKRQFGPEGIYRHLNLYSFADNHDVDRVASTLGKESDLYPLYCLLFSMPGIPSIYYGSEWGINGKRTEYSDKELRPKLDLLQIDQSLNMNLLKAIQQLIKIRANSSALRFGAYEELFVSPQQFAFMRRYADEKVIIVVNAALNPEKVQLQLPIKEGILEDLLNPGESFEIKDHQVNIHLHPTWGRIMVMHQK